MVTQRHHLEVQPITLTVATWVKLIGLVAAACAAFFGMFIQSQQNIYELDLKWKERIGSITRELHEDIHQIERQLPSRKDIENLDRDIKEIERWLKEKK